LRFSAKLGDLAQLFQFLFEPFSGWTLYHFLADRVDATIAEQHDDSSVFASGSTGHFSVTLGITGSMAGVDFLAHVFGCLVRVFYRLLVLSAFF